MADSSEVKTGGWVYVNDHTDDKQKVIDIGYPWVSESIIWQTDPLGFHGHHSKNTHFITKGSLNFSSWKCKCRKNEDAAKEADLRGAHCPHLQAFIDQEIPFQGGYNLRSRKWTKGCDEGTKSGPRSVGEKLDLKPGEIYRAMPIDKRTEFIEGHMVLSPTTRDRMIARNDIKWDLTKDHVAKVDEQVAADGDVTEAVKETLRLRRQAKDDATVVKIKHLIQNGKCAALKKDGQPCMNVRIEGQDGCHLHATMSIKVNRKNQKADKKLDEAKHIKDNPQVDQIQSSTAKNAIADDSRDYAEHADHIVVAKNDVDNQVQQNGVNVKCGKPTGSNKKGPPCKFNCLDGRDGCRHHATPVDEVHPLQIQQARKNPKSANSTPVKAVDNISIIGNKEDNALVVDNQQDEIHHDIVQPSKDAQLKNLHIDEDGTALSDDSGSDVAANTLSRCGAPTGRNKDGPPCKAFRLARADGCRHHCTRN